MQQLIEMLQNTLNSMGVKVDLSKLDTSAIMSKMSNMDEMKNEVISQLSSKFGVDIDTAIAAVESLNMDKVEDNMPTDMTSDSVSDMSDITSNTEEGFSPLAEGLNSKTSDVSNKTSNTMDQMGGLVDKVKGFFGGK